MARARSCQNTIIIFSCPPTKEATRDCACAAVGCLTSNLQSGWLETGQQAVGHIIFLSKPYGPSSLRPLILELVCITYTHFCIRALVVRSISPAGRICGQCRTLQINATRAQCHSEMTKISRYLPVTIAPRCLQNERFASEDEVADDGTQYLPYLQFDDIHQGL